MMSDAQNLQCIIDLMEKDFFISLGQAQLLQQWSHRTFAWRWSEIDQEQWFEPKMASMKEFMKTTKIWTADMQEPSQQEVNGDEIDPQDAIEADDNWCP